MSLTEANVLWQPEVTSEAFFQKVYCKKMWVRLSSLRKRGHQKPLLICQAIFIFFSNCSAVLHSMSFIIQRLKSIKKWFITTKIERVRQKQSRQHLCDGISIGQKLKKKNSMKGLTVLLKWKELRNQGEIKGLNWLLPFEWFSYLSKISFNPNWCIKD